MICHIIYIYIYHHFPRSTCNFGLHKSTWTLENPPGMGKRPTDSHLCGPEVTARRHQRGRRAAGADAQCHAVALHHDAGTRGCWRLQAADGFAQLGVIFAELPGKIWMLLLLFLLLLENKSVGIPCCRHGRIKSKIDEEGEFRAGSSIHNKSAKDLERSG